MDSSKLIYPFIIVAGCLQAAGAAMGGQLNKSTGNPWLVTAASFFVVFCFTGTLALVLTRSVDPHGIATMPWWAPLGGVVGAVAVFAGFLFIQKLGAGAVNGLTITANLIASLVIDHFALFGTQPHPVGWLRVLGAALMAAGVVLIARF